MLVLCYSVVVKIIRILNMKIFRHRSLCQKQTSWKEILLNLADFCLYIATVPFSQLLGLLLGYYLSMPTINDIIPANNKNKFKEKYIVGPCLALFSILCLPIASFAFLSWMLLCKTFKKNDAAYVVFENDVKHDNHSTTFKFVSGNLLLGPEFLGKIQNLPNVHKRLLGCADSLSMGNTSHYAPNCSILEGSHFSTEFKRDSAIIEEWPDNVDFVCLQEVWDRLSAITLIFKLCSQFKFFLTDICQDLGNSSHLFRTSGLFIASRYPVLETKVEFFQPVAFYQRIFAHACVFVKLDLSSLNKSSSNDSQLVGYLANVHLPAYENEKTSRSRNTTPLSRLHNEFVKFQMKTIRKNEDCAFSVITGDFNLCNVSPCDSFEQNNPIYSSYIDYCRVKPGVDHDWTIGTEVRQLSLLDPIFQSPESLGRCLNDDIKRRHYILDANLNDISPATPFILPQPNEHGEVVAEANTGGKRRVDKILYNPSCVFGTPNSFQFVTALASFTDHIPICMELKRNKWDTYIS